MPTDRLHRSLRATLMGLAVNIVLVLCVVGCATVRTSSLHCTSLSREEKELVCSDLNRLLKNNGFTAGDPAETPWALGCWENSSYSPLWKGRADFSVSAETKSNGMEIDVFYYKGQTSANKALVEAITACVSNDAPSKPVNIKVKTDIGPSWLGE